MNKVEPFQHIFSNIQNLTTPGTEREALVYLSAFLAIHYLAVHFHLNLVLERLNLLKIEVPTTSYRAISELNSTRPLKK